MSSVSMICSTCGITHLLQEEVEKLREDFMLEPEDHEKKEEEKGKSRLEMVKLWIGGKKRHTATQVATEEPEPEESVSVTDPEFDRAMEAWIAGMRAKRDSFDFDEWKKKHAEEVRRHEIENPMYDSDAPSSNIGNSRTDLELYMYTYVLYCRLTLFLFCLVLLWFVSLLLLLHGIRIA